jgi:FkbM family methyltransferase
MNALSASLRKWGIRISNWKWRWERRRNLHLTRKKQLWWEQNFGSPKTKPFRVRRNLALTLYADSVLCRVIDTQPFELQELLFIEAYLRPGDIFVDVGANIGLFTLIAADVVGNAGCVHCFEPSKKTFERLNENISRNRLKNVIARNLALSSESGSQELFVSTDGHDAWNSLAGNLRGNGGVKETVSVTMLDKYLSDNIIAPTLIKIDVEGWEKNVIQGGDLTLRRVGAPDLLVEFTESNCRVAGGSGKELFQTISGLGYKLYHLEEQLNLTPATCDDDFGYKNLLATKDLSRVLERIGLQKARDSSPGNGGADKDCRIQC